LIDWCLNNQLK